MTGATPVDDLARDFESPPTGVSVEAVLSLSFSHVPWATHAAAEELGFFRCLSNGPLDAVTVAEARRCHPLGTARLLDALVTQEWLVKEGRRYGLSSTARFFLGSWGVRKTPLKSHAFWGRLPTLVKGGRANPLRGAGQAWSDEAVQKHMELRALSGEFHDTYNLLEQANIVSGGSTLVDVASGHGLFGAGFKARAPHLSVTLFDLPSVVSVAGSVLARYGLQDVVAVSGGDIYTDPLPDTYDIVFISNLSPPMSAFGSICQKAFDALNPGGVLVYNDIVPHAAWSEAFQPLAHKLTVAVAWGDARAWEEWSPTSEEAQAMMKRVGFSRTAFLGWLARWCSVTAAWK